MPKVPASVLPEATECTREHACLREKGTRCEVSQILGKDLVFVKTHCHCAYNVSFGYTYACRCPVHRCICCRHAEDSY